VHFNRNVRVALLATMCLVPTACGGSSKKSLTGTGAAPLSAPASPMIVAGERFSVELLPSGQLFEWGHNATGELGDGTSQMRPKPVAVRNLAPGTRVVGVAAGLNHVLALASDGTVWAWGHNFSGQLGDGTKVDQPSPVRVKGLDDVRAVGAGDAFSVALKSDGTVLAWGNNQSGQLGDGNAPIDHASPAVVHGLAKGSGVIALTVGKSQALVLKSDGSVWGWGNGTSGELGDGGNGKRSAPTQVIGLGPGSGVVAIAAGGSHTFALKKDGSVLAFGNNSSGQLGDGTKPVDHNRPVRVKGLGPGSGVVSVEAGSSFGMALKADGSVLTWGKNKVGELGDDSTTDRSVPVEVVGLGPGSGIVAIAAGSYHALALKKDGSLVAWGDNSSGQVGDGTVPKNALVPVGVAAVPS
jgi:alpha-tubulin suppressor-like RCC1 family protein